MAHKPTETSSSPSSSARGYDETGTSSASTRTSPATSQSEERNRSVQSSFNPGSALVTPNDIRRSSLGDNRHKAPAGLTHEPDLLGADAQAKFFHQKLQDLDEAYLIKIRNLEREKERLIQRTIDPSYVADLETHYQDVLDSNQALNTEIEVFRLENKKLKDSNNWQQREIEHLTNGYTQKGIAIKPIDMDQQEQFNAKSAELREQLNASREENAELYEKCTALEQEIDELKSKDANAAGISDTLKLIKISKYSMLCEEELVSVRTDLHRLHDELHRSIESRMDHEGTMFETEDFEATSQAESRIIKDLQEQLRRHQDHFEELNERGFVEPPNLMAELENFGTMSAASSSVDEITPYRNVPERELKRVREELKRANEGFEEQKANNKKLITYMALWDRWISENKPYDSLEQPQPHMMFQEVGNILQDLERAGPEEKAVESIEERLSQRMTFTAQLGNVEEQDIVPETIPQFLQKLFINLWGGCKCIMFTPFRNLKLTVPVDANDEDVILSSFSRNNVQNGVNLDSVSLAHPRLTGKLWSEIIWLVCAGSEYWTEIAVDGRALSIKIQGPWWWALIIQLLMFTLVSSVAVAWWCIMTASAERELWLDANEITIKKYWDTAIWGAERDLLWRLCYGLGFV